MDKKILKDKVAIVVGSTLGIGLAVARRLAQDGAHVLICSRKIDNVERAVRELKEEGLNVCGIKCPLGNAEDRERLVEKALNEYGKIDILFCNASINPFVGSILDTTEMLWEKVFHVNVISTFLMIKLVVEHMEKQGGGSIIISSSFFAYLPQPYAGPYSISKTAQLSLVHVLAQALHPMNIRVNGLVFGLVRTRFSSVLKTIPDFLEKFKHFGLQRFGEPEECAGIVSFLCSTDASYINGENIAVTGGIIGRL